MTEVFHLLSYPCHEVKWCFPATEMDFALPVLSSPQHPVWPDPPFRDEHLHVAQKCKFGQGPWRSSLVMLQSCFPFSMAFWSDGVTSVESKRSETKNCQMRWKWVSCEIYLSAVQVQRGDKDLWWDVLIGELMGASSALKNLERKFFSPVWQMLR